MDFVEEKLVEYCEQNSSSEDQLLSELNRYTHTNVLRPRMLSGHLQGRFLAMISRLKRPMNILEIGTYTGYSALCLAEGIQAEGKLITLDIDEELQDIANSFFQRSKYAEQLEMRIGDANQIIPDLEEKFDLVFIDADKQQYSAYYDAVFDALNPGALIIADNVLWSGKVIEDLKPGDRDTEALLAFNKKVQEDSRVDNVLFPFRDGLMIIEKK